MEAVTLIALPLRNYHQLEDDETNSEDGWEGSDPHMPRDQNLENIENNQQLYPIPRMDFRSFFASQDTKIISPIDAPDSLTLSPPSMDLRGAQEPQIKKRRIVTPWNGPAVDDEEACGPESLTPSPLDTLQQELKTDGEERDMSDDRELTVRSGTPQRIFQSPMRGSQMLDPIQNRQPLKVKKELPKPKKFTFNPKDIEKSQSNLREDLRYNRSRAHRILAAQNPAF